MDLVITSMVCHLKYTDQLDNFSYFTSICQPVLSPSFPPSIKPIQQQISEGLQTSNQEGLLAAAERTSDIPSRTEFFFYLCSAHLL